MGTRWGLNKARMGGEYKLQVYTFHRYLSFYCFSLCFKVFILCVPFGKSVGVFWSIRPHETAFYGMRT